MQGQPCSELLYFSVTQLRFFCLSSLLMQRPIRCDRKQVQLFEIRQKDEVTEKCNSKSEHLKSLTKIADRARLVSDGFFVQTERTEAEQPDTQQRDTEEPGLANGAAGFVAGVNDEFRTRPDHHASITFRVAQIAQDGLTVAYESRFDHRSFGKDLTTIDRGEVHLNWRETE